MGLDPALAREEEEIAANSVINETIAYGNSPVQQFYSGATVFVTGGTGFVGKQLIEKLFRSSHIKKVYVLLRAKKNQTSNERINDMLQNRLFEYLFKNQPDFVTKIIPIEGDVSCAGLGMSDDNWKMLTEELDLIFHSAATINFVEPLKMATLTNVRGTKEMMDLAKACTKLKAFVHVSTAYVHVTKDRVGEMTLEKFYPSPVSPDFLMKLVEELQETEINAITPHILKGWANTYSFTKAVGEEVVRTYGAGLPISIVRPSIVMPCYREMPGWMDKSAFNGPVGMIAGAGLGAIHVMYGDVNVPLDIIPVDYVNNAILLAAYETATKTSRADEAKIYNIAATRAPTTISQIHNFLTTKGRFYISPKTIWYGSLIITSNKFLFILLTWLFHFIPGYLVDGVLWMCGQKQPAMRAYNKAYTFNEIYEFYMTTKWKFGESNLLEMYQKLSPSDKIIYQCDAGQIDQERYITISTLGARRYLLKDGLQGTLNAQRREKWLKVLNAIALSLYAYVLGKISIVFFSVTYRLLSTFYTKMSQEC